MKIITKPEEISSAINELKSIDKTIGLVPTMGALHQGHISLIEISEKENDISLVSIFVNPIQFDKKEDFNKYPKTIEKDIESLKKTNCDFVFIPSEENIYNKNYIVSENFNFDGLENEMEGKYRKNHFKGVGSIIKKLFEIIQPTRAYFGEKDFQQLQIIKNLTKKNNFQIEVIGCKTYREKDGLAMSSRNLHLTKAERKSAILIYEKLKEVKLMFSTKSIPEIKTWIYEEFKNHPILKLEYFEIADEKNLKIEIEKKDLLKYRAFIAVFAGSIRLIDNIPL